MEEKIIRPTTKPEAIKGKLLKYQGTDYCEFMPRPPSAGRVVHRAAHGGTLRTAMTVLQRIFPKASVKVIKNSTLEEKLDPTQTLPSEDD
jgi:hypothetical protein